MAWVVQGIYILQSPDPDGLAHLGLREPLNLRDVAHTSCIRFSILVSKPCVTAVVTRDILVNASNYLPFQPLSGFNWSEYLGVGHPLSYPHQRRGH